MTDKSALLTQLRIDRAPEPASGTGWLVWSAVGMALVAAAGAGLWVALGEASRTHVRAVAVAQAGSPGAGPQAAPALLDASGYIVARRQATVAAKITDRVISVSIEEGQRVEIGEEIARLDDTNTSAALTLTKAQLAEAQANLTAAKMAAEDARPNYQRQQKLVAAGYATAETLDQIKAGYDAAQASLMVQQQGLVAAEAAVAVAQRNQDDTVVRAPFAGIITVKAAQPGEIVSPISAGGGFTRTGIGTVVDMDSLEVEIDVNESFINRVHPNQATVIKLNAYPDWSISGSVITIIPTADRSKATVKVRIRILAKDPRILPEMGARVQFLGEAPAEPGAAAKDQVPALSVPVAAVQGSGETGIVYVIRDGKLERRTIRLGARTEAGQIVLSGLGADERLAVGDPAKLADGMAVAIDP